MTAEAAILTRSWPVGAHMCTLSVPPLKAGHPVQACIEWAPAAPHGLSADQWRQYRAGRDAALSDLAQALGINVAVVDL